MRRILYIEEAPSVGGSSFCLKSLVQILDKSSWEPFVLFRHELPVRSLFDAAGIPNATWPSIAGGRSEPPAPPPAPSLPRFRRTAPYRYLATVKWYLARDRGFASALSRWMRRERFDLVHANNMLSANAAALDAARRAGIPAVSHQRGFSHWTAFHRHLARGAAFFPCISNAVAVHCARRGLPRKAIATVYDPVDTAAFRPAAKAPGPFTVGWFGRFERFKGAVTLLEAAEIVCWRDPDARFVFAGAGPEEEALRERVARDPALSRSVSLLGFRSDVPALMAGCDAVVVSTIESEGLSQTLLEALALGIPCVGSRTGGIPEVITDGENGFLFEPGDAVPLAEALLKLSADPALRSRMGSAGRRRAEIQFNPAAHARAIEEIYREILEGRAPR